MPVLMMYLGLCNLTEYKYGDCKQLLTAQSVCISCETFGIECSCNMQLNIYIITLLEQMRQ